MAGRDGLNRIDEVREENLIHRAAGIAETYAVLTIPVINEFGYLEP